jgi:hypothetical protein
MLGKLLVPESVLLNQFWRTKKKAPEGAFKT